MARRYTDDERRHALELYAGHGLPEAVRRTGIGRSTIDRWAKAEGVRSPSRDHSHAKGAAARAATTAAHAETHAVVAARLAELAEERADLAELLTTRLAPTGADLIARRLARAEVVDAIVDAAVQRWSDRVAVAELAAEHGPEAAHEARQAVEAARAELLELVAVADRLTIPTRELVGIVSRSIADVVALEGAAQATAGAGDLIVELDHIPSPDPNTPVVAQADLPQQG